MSKLRLLAAASIGIAAAAHAQTTAPTADAAAPRSASASATPAGAMLTDGEVRKIDKTQGKLTLKHGPIPNLDMPAMTMVFKVADPKMLDSLKDGDKIRFSAQRVNGTVMVTAIEPAAR